MRLFSLLLVSTLFGCGGPSDTGETGTKTDDLDGDGWTSTQGDCDDDDATVYPTADEIWYDGVDQNCDGNDDDQDGDGVGFGDSDCDDTNAAVYPGATEVCDGVDNDCDGETDNDPADAATAFADVDGDGYGDDLTSVSYCGDLPEGASGVSGDCDDQDATSYPGAPELCDGADNDCNGTVDDGFESGTYYADTDADGYGDAANTLEACAVPEGYSADSSDCDDTDAATHPDAVEDCDATVDRNCDGDATAGATDGGPWYSDADGDGYGDDATVSFACDQPADTITLGGDCDDTAATVNPAGVETCNGEDDDCNGTVDDDATDALTWYVDADGDGVGGDTTELACEGAAGTSATTGDCDDADASAFPGGTEVCDGVDNDCDGSADNGAVDATTTYTDADGDGYGDDSTAVVSCSGTGVTVGGDCDDTSSAVSPGAVEACNSIDDDCDGSTDESGATGSTTYYQDADGDGYGSTVTTSACIMPGGYVTTTGDCDDTTGASHPGASEICDLLDNDCNGVVDDGFGTPDTYYDDLDGDGFGDDTTGAVTCSPGAGQITTGGDCDDSSADVNPAAAELCDGVDDDCDGVDDDPSTGAVLAADGTWEDISATLALGSKSDPILVGDTSTYDVVVGDGDTVYFCDGDFYAKIVVATSGNELTVEAPEGAERTSLTSGGMEGGASGSVVAVSNSTLTLRGLTITGGIGSSGTTGGGVVVSQTSGTTNPTTPNLTLEACLVTGNSTQYGGGIAVKGYGYVSLVDTEVYSNTASVAGGGVWYQGAGKVTCSASSLGAAGIYDNDGTRGGGVYFSSSTQGELSSVGCDWGQDSTGDDNYIYDAQVTTNTGKCYPNATTLSDTITCAAAVCTASTDTTCP